MHAITDSMDENGTFRSNNFLIDVADLKLEVFDDFELVKSVQI